MPHQPTKRHLPQDNHATKDKQVGCTLPLQWSSPEGTFTWEEILPGATALTQLWQRHMRSPRHTPPPHPRSRGRHKKSPHRGRRRVRDGKRGHRSVVTRPETHHTPDRGTRVIPRTNDHHTPTHRDKLGRSPASVDEQVATRIYQPCTKDCKSPSSPATAYSRPPPRPNRTTEQPPQPRSGPTHAPSTAGQRKPSTPPSPATKASCTHHTITRKKATPYGGNTPRQKGASNHQPTNLASASTSQQPPAASPPWPSKLEHHPNVHQPSSERQRHTTIQYSHTSGDAASIHPYQTSTSLRTMRGLSTSSCPTPPHPKQGTQQSA